MLNFVSSKTFFFCKNEKRPKHIHLIGLILSALSVVKIVYSRLIVLPGFELGYIAIMTSKIFWKVSLCRNSAIIRQKLSNGF
jgi:hypothetical protein